MKIQDQDKRDNKVSPDFTTVNQRDPSEGTAIVAPQEEIASIGDDSSRKDTEDPIFSNDITKGSCDQVTRTPPAGLELCEPLPVKEGQGCPEQYRYNTELTTEPPTIIVTTKGAIIEEALEESSGTPREISVHKNVPSPPIVETVLPTKPSRSHQIDLGTRHIVLNDPTIYQPGGEKDLALQDQAEVFSVRKAKQQDGYWSQKRVNKDILKHQKTEGGQPKLAQHHIKLLPPQRMN